MPHRIRIACVAGATCLNALTALAASNSSADAGRVRQARDYGKLPLAFEARGETTARAGPSRYVEPREAGA